MVEKLPRMRKHLLDKDLLNCRVCCEKVAVWIHIPEVCAADASMTGHSAWRRS